MATDFWISDDDYARSRLTQARLLLAELLRTLTAGQIDLGAFAFPTLPD